MGDRGCECAIISYQEEATEITRTLSDTIHYTIAKSDMTATFERNGTYISMKMEPNGRTPPNMTMTAGSMNLQ